MRCTIGLWDCASGLQVWLAATVRLNSSDPILALGAAKLWQVEWGEASAPESYILPHFRELVVQEMIDAGEGGGVVVARIVLLLAMGAAPSRELSWSKFVSVTAVDVLHGPMSLDKTRPTMERK